MRLSCFQKTSHCLQNRKFQKWQTVVLQLVKIKHFRNIGLWWMMNCFCGKVNRRKAFGLISSPDHCQRSSPSRVSDTVRAGFEPAQNLNWSLFEWNCALVITTKNMATFIQKEHSGDYFIPKIRSFLWINRTLFKILHWNDHI